MYTRVILRIQPQLGCVFPHLTSSQASTYASAMNSILGGSAAGSLLSNACHWAAFLANVGTERSTGNPSQVLRVSAQFQNCNKTLP